MKMQMLKRKGFQGLLQVQFGRIFIAKQLKLKKLGAHSCQKPLN